MSEVSFTNTETITSEQYKEFVFSRLSPNSKKDWTAFIQTAALGLAGEAGEVVDVIKKYLYHDKPLAGEDIDPELGDVLFYFTLLLIWRGLTIEQVMLSNVAKLKERYPNDFTTSKVEQPKLDRLQQATALAEKFKLFNDEFKDVSDKSRETRTASGCVLGMDDSPTIDDTVSIQKLKEIL